MKHTPGPWKTQWAEWIVVNETGALICALSDCEGNMPLSEVSANGRLISAAPELLAALETLRDYCKNQVAFDTDEAALWSQCQSIAATAIGKAVQS